MRTHRFRLRLLLSAILTCGWIAGISQARAEQSTVSVRAAAALISPVTVVLNDVPLKDAVESLAAQADVRVVWDEEALAEMDLPGEETVAIQTSQKLSLDNALCLVLEPLHLTFEDQGDSILITSRQKWGERVVKARYDVREILSTEFPVEDLVKHMTWQVINETNAAPWQDKDDSQPGFLLIKSGTMYVTHRRDVQQEVTWWLNTLRTEESR